MPYCAFTTNFTGWPKIASSYPKLLVYLKAKIGYFFLLTDEPCKRFCCRRRQSEVENATADLLQSLTEEDCSGVVEISFDGEMMSTDACVDVTAS